jgi:hypothetical protein
MPPWLIKLVSDPVVASWAQAAIYLVTLFVLIRQARTLAEQARNQGEAVRLQTRALTQAEYLRCQVDFTETTRLLVREKLHGAIYDDLASSARSVFTNWKNYSSEQKLVYAYLEMLYELFERVFVIWKDGWIADSEWRQWQVWIYDVIQHPLFADVHNDNLGMFDPRYQEYILAKLPRQRPDGPSDMVSAPGARTANTGTA